MTKPIYAIGDIHGMFDHFDMLLKHILTLEPGIIVTIGDYIDRGPDSKKVLDRLMSFNEPGWQMINLKGNHEDMAINNSRFWFLNGGLQTINSFPNQTIHEDYIKWMNNLPLSFETDNYIFVHAGLEPGLSVIETPNHSKLWIRDSFLNSDYGWGKRIIHGHTPRRDVQERPNRINIDTGCVFYGTLTCVVLKGTEPPKYIQVSGEQLLKLTEKDENDAWWS